MDSFRFGLGSTTLPLSLPVRGIVRSSTGRCCTWAGRLAPDDAWQCADAPTSPFGSPPSAGPEQYLCSNTADELHQA
jgi:hypothetical protein